MGVVFPVPSPPELVCGCGEPVTEFTFAAHRGIINRKTGRVVAPVTVTCLQGHTRELWVDSAVAEDYISDVIAETQRR